MILAAELPMSGDLLATGGSAGVVAFLAWHLIRRTRETDDRRDDATKFVVELATTREALAFAREAAAWRERDEALDQARREREALDRCRENLARARKAEPEPDDPGGPDHADP